MAWTLARKVALYCRTSDINCA